MASIPLPALNVQQQPQTDILGQFGKVAALKSLLQKQAYEQQMQPLQLQAQQQQLATGQLAYQEAQLKLKSDQAWADSMASELGQKQPSNGAAAAPPDTSQQPPPAAAVPPTPATVAPPTPDDQTGQTAPLSSALPPSPTSAAPSPLAPVAPAGAPPGPPMAPPAGPTQQGAPTGAAPQPVTAQAPSSVGDFLDFFGRVANRAMKNGATYDSVVGKMSQVLTMQDTFAKMSKTQQDTLIAQSNAAGELANGLVTAPPEKQAAIWAQDQQAIKMDPNAALHYGAAIAGYIANNPYPGPQAIADHLGRIQATDAMLKDQKTQLENKKLAPFSGDDLGQANASLQAAYTAQTGKPMPGMLFLKPGDGQQEYDNHMKMAEQIFGGADVAARKAAAEAAAKQPYEMALTQARENINAQFWNKKNVVEKVESDVFKPYNTAMDKITAAQAAIDQAAQPGGNIVAARAAVAQLAGVAVPPGMSRMASKVYDQQFGSLGTQWASKLKGMFTGDQWTPQMTKDAQDFIDSQGQTVTQNSNRAIGQISKLNNVSVPPLPDYQPKGTAKAAPPVATPAPLAATPPPTTSVAPPRAKLGDVRQATVNGKTGNYRFNGREWVLQP